MVVELISVGTEILLGNIVNTNAAFLSEKCAGLGLSCYYQSVVGDNEERLCQTIKTALDRSDIVILSGGLGPTQDDLTKECVAKVLGKELVMDEHSRQRIEDFFNLETEMEEELDKYQFIEGYKNCLYSIKDYISRKIEDFQIKELVV